MSLADIDMQGDTTTEEVQMADLSPEDAEMHEIAQDDPDIPDAGSDAVLETAVITPVDVPPPATEELDAVLPLPSQEQPETDILSVPQDPVVIDAVSTFSHTDPLPQQPDSKEDDIPPSASQQPEIAKSHLDDVPLNKLLESFTGDKQTDQARLDADPSIIRAPAIILHYAKEDYSLFSPCPEDDSLPVLFADLQHHHIFFDSIVDFAHALSDEFPAIAQDKLEMSFAFHYLDLELSEDNLYAREVSLFDLNRLFVGCNAPGRLEVTLRATPRFVSRFNAWMDHLAKAIESGEIDHDAEIPTQTEAEQQAADDDDAENQGQFDDAGDELVVLPEDEIVVLPGDDVYVDGEFIDGDDLEASAVEDPTAIEDEYDSEVHLTVEDEDELAAFEEDDDSALINGDDGAVTSTETSSTVQSNSDETEAAQPEVNDVVEYQDSHEAQSAQSQPSVEAQSPAPQNPEAALVSEQVQPTPHVNGNGPLNPKRSRDNFEVPDVDEAAKLPTPESESKRVRVA